MYEVLATVNGEEVSLGTVKACDSIEAIYDVYHSVVNEFTRTGVNVDERENEMVASFEGIIEVWEKWKAKKVA